MKEISCAELFIFNRMVEGDKEAFRFFFEKYYSEMCNFANVYLHDPVMSEEIVQDIYVYFWEKKENIHIESSVKSYLFRASINKSLNHIRNEKTRFNIQKKLSKESENIHEMPINNMDATQITGLIEKTINSLPPKCREVYILGKEKNLTYKEISSKMGISIKTIENHMGKALKTLREALKPYYDDMFVVFVICLFT
jgi:RNA polymerase sigma-70 factor, ECF subfamily